MGHRNSKFTFPPDRNPTSAIFLRKRAGWETAYTLNIYVEGPHGKSANFTLSKMNEHFFDEATL